MKFKNIILAALMLCAFESFAYGSKSKKMTRKEAEKACKEEFGSMTTKNMDKCIKRKMK